LNRPNTAWISALCRDPRGKFPGFRASHPKQLIRSAQFE
jgi:hypothetical protein